LGPYNIGLNTQNLLAILSIALLTWVNLRGITLGTLVQNLFTYTKIGVLAGVILLGVLFANASALKANFSALWQPLNPGLANAWQGDGGMALTIIGVAMVGSALAAFGPAGAAVMALAVMISTFGCNNGLILSGARISYAMAKDGLFFKAAAGLNAQHAPAAALFVQGIWASLLCLSGTYGQLLDFLM